MNLELLFYLIAFHFIGDFVLQSPLMARMKNRHINRSNESPMHMPNWYYWLFAHSITHGVIVALVTGNIIFGLTETVLHGIIDFGKCEKKYNLHIDQFMHIVCKIVWSI